jgi:hypothetical protein
MNKKILFAVCAAAFMVGGAQVGNAAAALHYKNWPSSAS